MGDATAGGARVYEDDLFTVDHADGCLVPGYLIVRLKGPATALGRLAPEVSRRVGEMLARAAGAIEETVAPERVYCLAFAEIEPRLHFHLFPRTRALLEAYHEATGTAGEPVNGPKLFEWARTAVVAGRRLPAGLPELDGVLAGLRERLAG